MLSIRQSISIRLIKLIQQFGPRNVTVMDRSYEISKNVFNPKYYVTSQFMAENIIVEKGSTVLDIGTGSGIQAITAGLTASRVIAVDINPEAVQCALRNVAANNLENTVTVLEGDLFSPLGQDLQFDTILFTPPYMQGEPRTDFEHALYDGNKLLVRRFFSEAGNYLKKDGYVQMLYSSIADPDQVLRISAEYGWEHSGIAQKNTLTERFFIYKLWIPYKRRQI